MRHRNRFAVSIIVRLLMLMRVRESLRRRRRSCKARGSMRMRLGMWVCGLGVRSAMVVRRPLRELLLVSRHRMRVSAR